MGMWPALATFLLGLVLAAVIWWRPAWVALRRAHIRRHPFPAAWRRVLRDQVPAVALLPADLQLKLKGDVLVFLAEKPFVGCAGLVVTDDMRLVVAAQACLLQLGRRNHFFPSLREVLLYPRAFVVQRTEHDGLLQRDVQRALAGESWSQGQVVLSWEDVLAGARDARDGHNVVVHEFAHQLDQEKGMANGAPPLPRGVSRKRWAEVLQRAHARLREQLKNGEPTVLDAYGASERAEFFAVACELFFENAEAMARDDPALYEQMCLCHQVNPLSWR